MMDIRNPVLLADGRIDCEIEHPVYGWIPFTASPDDVEPLGRAVFEASSPLAAPYVAPVPDPVADLAEVRAGMRVSNLQAKAAIYNAGLFASVESVIAEAGFMAQLAWNNAAEFRRNSPLINALAAGLNLSDDTIDDLFRAATLIEF